MQNDEPTAGCPREREPFYDIWQADRRSVDPSDDESTPRTDNCVSSEDGTIDGTGRVARGDEDRLADARARIGANDEDDGGGASDLVREDSSDSIGDRDRYRMRGGCGGCCAGSRENVGRSSQDRGCCGGGSCCCCCCSCRRRCCRCSCCCSRADGGLAEPNESCAATAAESSRRDGGNKVVGTACSNVPSRCRCRYVVARDCRRAVCKKSTRCDEMAARTATGARGCCCCCGGGGCCGGCGQPGRICAPSSPCARPRCPRSPTADRPSGGCGGGYECGSPRCRSTVGSGCCISGGGKCGTGAACCRLKLPAGCECLGGGLDCRRCGRKVYQAEMQIASGVPYHNICFSCFCCRKPLEPLTYQENCGEIYCKQCYVRNFGPQGYGYGVGAGALQTPM